MVAKRVMESFAGAGGHVWPPPPRGRAVRAVCEGRGTGIRGPPLELGLSDGNGHAVGKTLNKNS